MKLKDKEAWAEWEKNNQSDYGKACVDVARRVMEILDEGKDFDPYQIICQADEDIQAGGITGRNLRQAIFIYEAARLEAEISNRPIVPEPWSARDEAFCAQFVRVVEKQTSEDKFPSAEAAHDSWWREYERMGWRYGPERDVQKKIHPDMVPFHELPKSERDKDEIFLRLCAVAEVM